MMDVGKIWLMNAEADSFVCYSKWSERRDGAEEGAGATCSVLLRYLCGEPEKNGEKLR